MVMVALLFALLFSGCTAPDRHTQATMDAVYEQARIATNGTVTLENGASYTDITASAVAVNAVLTAQPGAYALYNDAQHLAVFLSPAGTNAQGVQYYLYGVINTSRTCIVDAQRILTGLGIDSSKLRTLDELKEALRAHGFSELNPVAVPTLIATLRLGMGFLRSLGGALSDVLVVPAIMLMPEQIYPFCNSDNCQTIDS
jgi:hypothetical protein